MRGVMGTVEESQQGRVDEDGQVAYHCRTEGERTSDRAPADTRGIVLKTERTSVRWQSMYVNGRRHWIGMGPGDAGWVQDNR
jgi:hypothetical protein